VPTEASPSLLRGKTALVTGAGGYIAGALVPALLERECRVVRLSRRELTPLAGVEDIQGDPRDPECWTGPLLEADAIFHLAGETSAYAAAADPLNGVRATLLPLIHLTNAFAAAGRRPVVVMAGTVTVLGSPERVPADDDTPLQPLGFYDAHKLMAEMHLRQAVRAGQVRGCTLRLANVYGIGPRSQGAEDRGVLDRMVRRALACEAITVYGDGSQLRDYIHLDDVVSAFMSASCCPDAWDGGAMMVASGEGHTLVQAFSLAAERVATITGRPRVEIKHVAWPSGALPTEFRHFVGRPTRLPALTGWLPTIRLREGLDRSAAILTTAR
jgi:nucleoside-diphosphate-sugar epimerase